LVLTVPQAVSEKRLCLEDLNAIFGSASDFVKISLWSYNEITCEREVHCVAQMRKIGRVLAKENRIWHSREKQNWIDKTKQMVSAISTRGSERFQGIEGGEAVSSRTGDRFWG
jgi:hypothetical protein